MLNFNQYDDRSGGLFRYGLMLGLGGIAINKFASGELKVTINGPSINSPGSGHWPFQLFAFVAVGGLLSAWQLTICGLTIGRKKFPDVNDDGTIAGPDYRKTYWLFSCLNHRDKILEEII